MKVLYILNESPFYIKAAWFSLNSLRYYNPDIPVEILMIRDGGRDNRGVAPLENIDYGLPNMTQEQFAHEAVSRFKVSLTWVDDYDPGTEVGFPPAQRKEFRVVSGEEVLFLDADTFILDEIYPLFDYPHAVTADFNVWTKFWNTPLEGTKSFNSGVVLYRHGLHRDYGEKLHGLISRCRHNHYPEGQWLANMEKGWIESGKSEIKVYVPGQEERTGREELAFCLWASTQDSGHFRDTDVQSIQTRAKTRIFHTMTQHWYTNWKRFYRMTKFIPPKKIKPMLLTK